MLKAGSNFLLFVASGEHENDLSKKLDTLNYFVNYEMLHQFV